MDVVDRFVVVEKHNGANIHNDVFRFFVMLQITFIHNVVLVIKRIATVGKVEAFHSAEACHQRIVVAHFGSRITKDYQICINIFHLVDFVDSSIG